ncbi:hypothetical protein [Streptomyces sp. NRRL S-646]
MTRTPQRLSVEALAALCDILDCSPPLDRHQGSQCRGHPAPQPPEVSGW